MLLYEASRWTLIISLFYCSDTVWYSNWDAVHRSMLLEILLFCYVRLGGAQK